MNIKSERLRAFFIVAAIEISSYKILPFAPRNELYFGACGIFLAINAIFLWNFFKMNNLIFDLLFLTGIQLLIQMLGLANYEFSILPREIYIYSSHTIVAITLIRFLIVRGNDRNTARSHGFNLARFFAFMGRRHVNQVSL
jgi:hypothetical protein